MSTEIVIFIDTYALYTHTYTLHIHIHIYACSNNEQDTVNLKKKIRDIWQGSEGE